MNPTIEDVTSGARMYREEGCDLIVAVGGGSATPEFAKTLGVEGYDKNAAAAVRVAEKLTAKKASMVHA